MPWNKIPNVDKCCGCIPDLKMAVIIIAVLGIVTSPAVSWAVVRHAYMIRVSCVITGSVARPDVVDINLNNVLSFGFGANSGLGPSCLSPEKDSTASLVLAVKYLGWVALLFDFIFLISSIYLLVFMNIGDPRKAIKRFMIAVTLSIIISFVYAMLYISACVQIGGSFPVFEFIFAFVDVGIMAMWIYFLLVLRSYIKSLKKEPQLSYFSYDYWSSNFGNLYNYIYDRLSWLASPFYRRQIHNAPTSILGSPGHGSPVTTVGMTFHTHQVN